MRVTWFSLVDLRSQRKPLKVTFLFYIYIFEIVQIEDIGDREGGSGKTRFIILALTKWPTFLLCKSAVQVCVIVNHNMSIYSRLNHKLLVQIGDFLVHKVGGLRAITMD